MAGVVWGMRAFYALNIVGAGSTGVRLLLEDDSSKKAVQEFWGAPVQPPLAKNMLGSMWLSTALVSAAGLFAPVTFSPLLLFQFGYKAVLLVKSTIPALLRRSKPADDAPIKVGTIFSTYALILPFFLPWSYLLHAKK